MYVHTPTVHVHDTACLPAPPSPEARPLNGSRGAPCTATFCSRRSWKLGDSTCVYSVLPDLYCTQPRLQRPREAREATCTCFCPSLFSLSLHVVMCLMTHLDHICTASRGIPLRLAKHLSRSTCSTGAGLRSSIPPSPFNARGIPLLRTASFSSTTAPSTGVCDPGTFQNMPPQPGPRHQYVSISTDVCLYTDGSVRSWNAVPPMYYMGGEGERGGKTCLYVCIC